ncbi:MAG TPA: dethiobiotin synthase [Micromonosporaceae bacterium]|nr:dethiobiotin synthase [Micromonosporaceae bacterium]
MPSLSGLVLVTGTDTGVGKTIVTAAIAAAATIAGLRVAVIKPAQTGDDSDEKVVRQLAAPSLLTTLVFYPDPLAPLAAARVSGREPLDIGAVTEAATKASEAHDLVLIEGAGGLLVPMGPKWTMADLAAELQAPAIVVTRPALGTLNHTALTLEALQRRDIPSYLVLGSWPAEPELVHYTNLADFPVELHGKLPEGAGEMEPGAFRQNAPGWLSPILHGNFSI